MPQILEERLAWPYNEYVAWLQFSFQYKMFIEDSSCVANGWGRVITGAKQGTAVKLRVISVGMRKRHGWIDYTIIHKVPLTNFGGWSWSWPHIKTNGVAWLHSLA